MNNRDLLYKKLRMLRYEIDGLIVDDIITTVDALFLEQNLPQNPMLSVAFLQGLGWYELQPIAIDLIGQITDTQLHEKLLEIYPLEEGQQYVGSLSNHYRGRLKNEGKESLVNQMCNNSMRRLIIGLSGCR